MTMTNALATPAGRTPTLRVIDGERTAPGGVVGTACPAAPHRGRLPGSLVEANRATNRGVYLRPV